MENLITQYKAALEAMPAEERAVAIREMTELIRSMNRDVQGMNAVLQEAKDSQERQALQEKLQGQ